MSEPLSEVGDLFHDGRGPLIPQDPAMPIDREQFLKRLDKYLQENKEAVFDSRRIARGSLPELKFDRPEKTTGPDVDPYIKKEGDCVKIYAAQMFRKLFIPVFRGIAGSLPDILRENKEHALMQWWRIGALGTADSDIILKNLQTRLRSKPTHLPYIAPVLSELGANVLVRVGKEACARTMLAQAPYLHIDDTMEYVDEYGRLGSDTLQFSLHRSIENEKRDRLTQMIAEAIEISLCLEEGRTVERTRALVSDAIIGQVMDTRNKDIKDRLDELRRKNLASLNAPDTSTAEMANIIRDFFLKSIIIVMGNLLLAPFGYATGEEGGSPLTPSYAEDPYRAIRGWSERDDRHPSKEEIQSIIKGYQIVNGHLLEFRPAYRQHVDL